MKKLGIITEKRRRNRQPRLRSILVLVAVAVAVWIAALSLSGALSFDPVKDSMTIEAGALEIRIADFLNKTTDQAEWVTDIASIDRHQPGTYPVQIKVGRRVYESSLLIVDTVPPAADVVTHDISELAVLQPEDFLSAITDATQVAVRFDQTPSFGVAGEYPVQLILTDLGGNTTRLDTKLRISNIVAAVNLELGSNSLDPTQLVQDPSLTASVKTDLKTLDLSTLGEHPIEVECSGKSYTTKLVVVDTTPPAGTTQDVSLWLGEQPEATAFVSTIADKTRVTVSYDAQPDFNREGEQTVLIALSDEGGNRTVLTASLTLTRDNEAPKINGVRNRTIFLGETILYKSGVTITDNRDQDVKLEIDNSKVNLAVAGDYPMVYFAVDQSGNRTEVPCTISVLKPTPQQEEVYAMADKILMQITNEGMTKREKAWAIHQWCHGNIFYTGDTDDTSAIDGAYQAFKFHEGDCFTYYAAAEILLTRAGIDNMRVTRVGGSSNHYWNLVNCGDGWYHFDCSWRIHGDYYVTFMKTDAEVAAYTADYTRRYPNHPNYYTFDPSLYPERGK